MHILSPFRLSFVLLLCPLLAAAQTGTGIGTLRTEGARLTGLVAVSAGTATIQSSGTVEAGREATEVRLTRGGLVRVCGGSVVAFSQANGSQAMESRGGAVVNVPLLIALQRGAAEVQTRTLQTDAILTPDLRLQSSDNAPLDLRLRVNAGGDTCVENLGKGAPMLHATEQFGSAGYLIKPGQRVLFEHGSVREVVDREGTSCGCPKPGKGGKDDFPEAVSAGMVQPDPAPVASGSSPVQVAADMNYKADSGGGSGAAVPVSATSPTPAQGASGTVAPAAATKQKSGANPFSAIGRFFRRLFGGH